MASLKKPFTGKGQFELGMNIRKGKFERIPMRYSENLQNAINNMLKLNPEERPSAKDFLNMDLYRVRR